MWIHKHLTQLKKKKSQEKQLEEKVSSLLVEKGCLAWNSVCVLMRAQKLNKWKSTLRYNMMNSINKTKSLKKLEK